MPKPTKPTKEAPRLIDNATYRQQFIRCGNPKCKRCKVHATHGPYWYAEWQSDSGRRTRTSYVGRKLPPEIAAFVAITGSPEARAAAQEQLSADEADEDVTQP